MDPNNPYGQQPQQPQQPAANPYNPQGYPQQPAGVQSPRPGYYPEQPQAPFQQPYPSPQQNVAQSQDATQYPVDYLNQISSTQPVKKLNPFIVFGAIGGIIILAIVAMFVLLQSAAPPSANAQLHALQARIGTLDKAVAEQGKHLTQSKLSAMNSNIGVMMKSMSSQVSTYMKERKVSTEGKSSVAARNAEKSYAEKLSTKFNNAYLTGTLDRVYASEMTYQLSMLKSKMQSVKAAAKSSKFNEIYTHNIESLDKISTELSNFQNTK